MESPRDRPASSSSSRTLHPKKSKRPTGASAVSSKSSSKSESRPQFLFVPNAGPLPSQSRRVKQICNAHVQYNAHRRRSIARRKQLTDQVNGDDILQRSGGNPMGSKSPSPPTKAQKTEGGPAVFLSPPSSSRSKELPTSPLSPMRSPFHFGEFAELPFRRRQAVLGTSLNGEPTRHLRGRVIEEDEEGFNSPVSTSTIDLYESSSRPALPSPAGFFDPYDFDPFRTTAAPLPRGMQFLLQHFWQGIVPTYFPKLKNPRAYAAFFVPLIISDPSALHSSVFAWSAHLEAVKGYRAAARTVTSTPQWPIHRQRAIQSVNEKLEDPKKALEVSTLLSVGNLMAANVSETVSAMVPANIEELAVYAEGFQRLLTLRGGWHGFPTHVIKIFLRLRYYSALMTGHLPPAPPLVPERPLLLRNLSSHGVFPELASAFSPLLDANLISPVFHNIVQVLASVTRSKPSYYKYQHFLTRDDQNFFDLQDLDIEYQMLAFARLETNFVVPVQDALLLSMIIFYYTCITEHNPTKQVTDHLTRRLRAVLIDVFSKYPGGYTPIVKESILWALCMGAMVSRNEPDNDWFIDGIVAGAKTLPDLEQFDDLLGVMQRFFYLEPPMLEYLEDTWDRVSLAKESYS